MRYYFLPEDGQEHIIDINKMVKTGRDWHVEMNSRFYQVRKVGNHLFYKDQNEWKKLLTATSHTKKISHGKSFQLYRGFKPSGLSTANPAELVTQMPGKVVKILAKVGDKVILGQTLLILEAMKMENEIKAGLDGVVKAVHVLVGQTLDSGVLMLEIEA